MSTKEVVEGPESTKVLLKTTKESVNEAGLAPIIPAGGLSAERQAYLYKEIRQFVPPAFQDNLCPAPAVAAALLVRILIVLHDRCARSVL